MDTWVGMAVSNGVAFFIMLTAAATLHAHHVEVKTTADAASALKPIAGNLAFALFSLGIIGTGLLALPVLAGSAAYAAAGTMKWRNSLALQVTSGEAVLWRGRGGDSRRHCAHIHAARPDQSAVLERGDQRRRGRSDHGARDGDGGQPQGDGPVRRDRLVALARLDRYRSDGARCGRHVLARMIARVNLFDVLAE